MWSFSWHYEGMKEDALQKGLPAPDETAVRELVLAKNVEAPDLGTVKDFPLTSGSEKSLSKEGVVVHITRPKHNFTERDVRRLLRTPWA
jgi:hypothetical protein